MHSRRLHSKTPLCLAFSMSLTLPSTKVSPLPSEEGVLFSSRLESIWLVKQYNSWQRFLLAAFTQVCWKFHQCYSNTLYLFYFSRTCLKYYELTIPDFILYALSPSASTLLLQCVELVRFSPASTSCSCAIYVPRGAIVGLSVHLLRPNSQLPHVVHIFKYQIYIIPNVKHHGGASLNEGEKWKE